MAMALTLRQQQPLAVAMVCWQRFARRALAAELWILRGIMEREMHRGAQIQQEEQVRRATTAFALAETGG
jgi:hypothetical protein